MHCDFLLLVRLVSTLSYLLTYLLTGKEDMWCELRVAGVTAYV